ncbi:thiosulfate oxidation carrier complex protein SoxZ [Primorskyibacter sp. 2E233]|uniref:thiosulfate oxidation carrier complex protein SoxZ n=1 Tax=Primorskyibacter sp. 2E233 TaxID=3413431 RepID=UPI003BEFA078
MKALLNIPEQAARGDILQVKVLIRHPMETGFRSNRDGKIVPRDIIHEVRCTYGGAEVFGASFFPAVSANPFLSFYLRAEQTGEVTIRWIDEGGTEYSDARMLTVT